MCSSDGCTLLYPDTLGPDVPRLDYDFGADHGRTYRIMKCGRCTHRFAIPTRRDLWKEYEGVEDPAYMARTEERAATFRKLVKRIHRFCPGGRLLDVGCATGDFLDSAQAFFDVEGVELSKWSSQIATERGFRVHRSRLPAVSKDSAYDVITLWGVIGLFEHPHEEAAAMARLVKPGGLVCVWTGDMASLPARILGRKYWYVMGQYLQLYTATSLCRMFEMHGFERAWMGTYPFTSSLRLLTNSLGRYPVVGGVTKALVHRTFLSRVFITLLLPGEMFAIFRKKG
ncbi:class I SAM-dependent methyltransferase [Candidatus Fermentibacteria bacterium]|nr:class I SAM-dependent methyltransferase [Candidatus Fermentibacteria bacterium]